ncbi:aldo/keto reductase [Comamonas sp. MYb396]|uniref:aldo/keto reductase n=1 Tax=Comamonas sp. MYb396 TaxID=2745302 RepID=UPI00309CD04B
MQYRQLGASPLQVSALCLGTMMFADQTDLQEAAAIVADARAQGVNFIDTADIYSKGESERMVGQLLQGQRDDWVLATKLGNAMGSGPNQGYYSRAWMLREVEASLRRLQTDRIDILYLHRDRAGLQLQEPLYALKQLIDSGKILYWGLSNFRGWRIVEAVYTAREIGLPPPIVCQPYYNLLNRMPETDILPACAQFGIGVVPFSPIARGVLSGKYQPGMEPPKDSRAGRQDARILQTEFRPESLVIAQQVQQHAEQQGISAAQFATAWVLAHNAISAVIAGPRTLKQWQDYQPALNYQITVDDERLVNGLVSPGHPSTPGYSDPAHLWPQGRLV